MHFALPSTRTLAGLVILVLAGALGTNLGLLDIVFAASMAWKYRTVTTRREAFRAALAILVVWIISSFALELVKTLFDVVGGIFHFLSLI